MMVDPFRNRVQFMVESLLLSGTLARLLMAALLIFLVAVLMGLLGFVVSLGTGLFAGPLEAIWWAFLRLSDPGYLGDDEGLALRTVSTILTVAGSVLFLGVLVAILTQGLNEHIRRLEMGLTPISARRHIILLGWSQRTPNIVRNLLSSQQRVKRFLRRVGARRLRLVLLIEEVSLDHTSELRTYLGRAWSRRAVTLRSGSPLRLDHLKRVDYLRASTIVLPAEDLLGGHSAATSDDGVIKTILSISQSTRLLQSGDAPPLLVAELYDARKIPTALHCYRGPIEVVAGDEVVSRTVAQMVRHPQISFVYRELLSHAVGNEIFVRDTPADLVGTDFWRYAECLQQAVLLGVIQRVDDAPRPLLSPPPGYRIRAGDKLVYVARDWADGTAARPSGELPGWPSPARRLERFPREDQQILILGWSRRIPALLAELESYRNQRFEVTIVSRSAPGNRQRQIDFYGVDHTRVRCRHIDTDYTVPDLLQAIEPAQYDGILCIASDMTESEEDADARTLVSYAILRDILLGAAQSPRILVELLDELNVALLDPRDSEYLLSPQILSHMLVQVALRRELNLVYQELFNSSETEIFFRNFERYGLNPGDELCFPDIESRARAHTEIALGIYRAAESAEYGGGIHLNPDRSTRWRLEPGDQFVVLRR